MSGDTTAGSTGMKNGTQNETRNAKHKMESRKGRKKTVADRYGSRKRHARFPFAFARLRLRIRENGILAGYMKSDRASK